ncbi:nicotinate phosphoribosyltransferase [Limosilactobacillus viscerum]|uniref:nicotinate phosphoribosyltransferase n=1 Tax=Limosilactobacillus viscerum TaxID=2993450 RepID=UPI0024BB27AB|nr:nicotinate phosphoribosyltransferase [Limosilactobacillus viscerum]
MNHELLTDMYEFSMANGYYLTLSHDKQARFDVFYRKAPDDGSFVISAGLKQVVDEVKNWHFSPDDIAYLKSLKHFSDDFLFYLTEAHNRCSIEAFPEGTPVFPQEPFLSITGPLMDVQLLETLILNIINHQSLIATKAWQITNAAENRPVMEFGARRAQGPDAAIYGARAAIIGGCGSTSNVLAAKLFNVPAVGTMAHAWIESFPDEFTAFRAWAKIYPDNAALLVDTYDVLQSGVPNAIKVFKELRAAGHEPVGIRIDSGDIAQLAKQARKMMDDAGFPNAKITASNALDAHIIKSLLNQGAPLDNFGIGERLITSSSSPVLSGVYKMAALENKGKWEPKIKISNSREKVTLPGHKQVYRLYDKHDPQHAVADVIALADEQIGSKITAISADVHVTRNKVILTDFIAKPLLQQVLTPNKTATFEASPFVIQRFAKKNLAQLPAATQRLLNPDRFPVYLTKRLADLQQKLIDEATNM